MTAPSADKTEAMVEGTLTEGQLRADVTKTLKNVELVDRPHCEFAIVKQLHSPGNPGVEPWTAKTCDTTTTYRIVLIPSRRGGTDIAFSRVESEGVQPRNAQPESEPGKGPVPPFEVEGI